jgi:hypothetical protein
MVCPRRGPGIGSRTSAGAYVRPLLVVHGCERETPREASGDAQGSPIEVGRAPCEESLAGFSPGCA